MKKLVLSLLLACLSLPVLADTVTISMKSPTTYVDGTPILSSDTITCNLYGASGNNPLVYLDSGPCTSFVRIVKSPGALACYSVTAVSTLLGTESDKAAKQCVTIFLPPPKVQPTNPPSSVTVTSTNP